MPQAVFRVDASVRIGSGHVRRCLTLADALGAVWDIRFASRSGTRQAVPALARANVGEIALAEGANDANALCRALPQGCDLLVVDHYGLDADFERACRGWARRILVLDDLADRQHDCDVLVDQTPGRDAADYGRLVPAGCQVMAGAPYALLDRRFHARRAQPTQAPETARSILVNFGGTDPDGMTAMAVEALIAAGFDGRAHIVLARDNARFAEVEKSASDLPGAVILTDVDDMAGLMAGCDMALGAGGVTSLERCCVGLPSLIVQVADNQRGNARALAQAGASRDLGPAHILCKADLMSAVASMAADRLLRQGMSLAGRMLVDGLGAPRVAAACQAPQLALDGRPVRLRPATWNDKEYMLEWQSVPGIRAFSRHPNPPGREDHERWLEAKLRDPRCFFNVIELGDSPAGVLRLDGLEGDGVYEVSILVAPGWHGLGVGGAALALAAQTFPAIEMRAIIRADNAASIRMFERQGYVRCADEEWRLTPRRNDRT